jgi:hypothetical protein
MFGMVFNMAYFVAWRMSDSQDSATVRAGYENG